MVPSHSHRGHGEAVHCAWAVAPGAPKSEPRPQNGCRQSSVLWGEARGGTAERQGPGRAGLGRGLLWSLRRSLGLQPGARHIASWKPAYSVSQGQEYLHCPVSQGRRGGGRTCGGGVLAAVALCPSREWPILWKDVLEENRTLEPVGGANGKACVETE